MRTEPYEVIWKGHIGPSKVPVQVNRCLSWAEIEVRNSCYIIQGRADNPNHLFEYLPDGHRRLATLEIVLRNALRCPPGDDSFKARLREVQPVVAAYREAKAKAKHFFEHWGEAENHVDLEVEILRRLDEAEARRAKISEPALGLDDEIFALMGHFSLEYLRDKRGGSGAVPS